jgi:branched-chain amino acid aminotransferase
MSLRNVPGCAYIDGAFAPIAEAKISILDWGFLHSDATYDVVTVWDGHFFRLDDHLDRFFAGLQKLRMQIPYTRAQIVRILDEMVARSGLREAYVEFLCTRGMPEPGSRDPRTCVNRFHAFAIPYVWIVKPDQQQVGLHAHLSPIPRIAPASVDPTVKNYHWLDMVMGLFAAYDQGMQSVILRTVRATSPRARGSTCSVCARRPCSLRPKAYCMASHARVQSNWRVRMASTCRSGRCRWKNCARPAKSSSVRRAAACSPSHGSITRRSATGARGR